MKTNRIFGILAIFLLLVAIPSASAAVYFYTDKTTYNPGDSVKFTIRNTGYQAVRVDLITVQNRYYSGYNYKWKNIYDPYICVPAGSNCVIAPAVIRINSGQSYSWTWDQSKRPAPDACILVEGYDCTKVNPGTYRGTTTLYNSAGYKMWNINSNTFTIKTPIVVIQI